MITPLNEPPLPDELLHMVSEEPAILQLLLYIVILLSDEQDLKASLPITLTLAGTSTEPSDVQMLNAPSPISVTVFGIVTDERLLQFINAYEPMVVIPLAISADEIRLL